MNVLLKSQDRFENIFSLNNLDFEKTKDFRLKEAAECGCRAAFFPAEMDFPLCSFIDHAECISPKV